MQQARGGWERLVELFEHLAAHTGSKSCTPWGDHLPQHHSLHALYSRLTPTENDMVTWMSCFHRKYI